MDYIHVEEFYFLVLFHILDKRKYDLTFKMISFETHLLAIYYLMIIHFAFASSKDPYISQWPFDYISH